MELHCVWAYVSDEKVLWSDRSKIYKLGYDGSSEAEFYQAGSSTFIMDMKVVDDYIYYVGHNEQ